ncbi:hypothetical protein [Streptomyces sp. NBC_00344]|uniref:hypothetical protein n=1 Tax=Streptomyces sp. NBC_00344 TaxID=2975720 RepID=UPI002E24E4A1
MAFDRADGFRCLVNAGDTPLALPGGATVLLSSGDLDGPLLPSDTAVWLSM